jgi:hypothetical protein
MHPSRLFFLVMVSAFVAGCSSGDAFVDRSYMTKSVKKQKLPGYNGSVTVCYGSDTPRQVRDDLAREACAVYGLQPLLQLEARWQCRFTVPHQAAYACIDPEMRLPGGGYINPFNATQVEAWQRANGKLAKPVPQSEDEQDPAEDAR